MNSDKATYPPLAIARQLLGAELLTAGAENVLFDEDDNTQAASRKLAEGLKGRLLHHEAFVEKAIAQISTRLASCKHDQKPADILRLRLAIINEALSKSQDCALAIGEAGEPSDLVTRSQRRQMFLDAAAVHAELVEMVSLMATSTVRSELIAVVEKINGAIITLLESATNDIRVFAQFRKGLKQMANRAHAQAAQGAEGKRDDDDDKLLEGILASSIMPLLVKPIGELSATGAQTLLAQVNEKLEQWTLAPQPLSEVFTSQDVRAFLGGHDFTAGIVVRRAMSLSIAPPLVLASVPADIALPSNVFGDATPQRESAADLSSLHIAAFNFTPIAGLEIFSETTWAPTMEDFFAHSAEPENADAIAAIFAGERARLHGNTKNNAAESHQNDDHRRENGDDDDARRDSDGDNDGQGDKLPTQHREVLCFRPFEISSDNGASAIHEAPLSGAAFRFANGSAKS